MGAPIWNFIYYYLRILFLMQLINFDPFDKSIANAATCTSTTLFVPFSNLCESMARMFPSEFLATHPPPKV